MAHSVTFSSKEGKQYQLSESHHSVIKKSRGLMHYRPIIHESIAQ